MPIDGKVSKAKAEAFAGYFNVNQNLKGSDGWLKIFKTQNGLIFKIL